MAYNTPPTKAVGNTISAADWNTYIRDNFAYQAPDVFSAKGDMYIATGANTGQALAAGGDYQIIEALATEAVGMRWTNSGVGAILGRSTAISIPDNATTQITGFDVTYYDKGGMVSGDTIIIPADGVYLISVTGDFSGAGTTNKLRQLGSYDTMTYSWQSAVADANTSNIHIRYTRIYNWSSSKVVTATAFQISGGALNLNNARFAVMKLR